MYRYINFLMLIVFQLSIKTVHAQQFITQWQLANTSTISFYAETTGPVAYSWETVPPGINGSGTFNSGTVVLSGLPSNSTIRLHIDSTNFNRFKMYGSPSSEYLYQVEQWGAVLWTSMEQAFDSCINLGCVCTIDTPNLSNVTSMSRMFKNCSLYFFTNSNNWNTANVQDMSELFYNTNFNQSVSNWNTGNVTNMSGMFCKTPYFSSPLGNWNTNNVTDMSNMFAESAFNYSIGSWNTSNVTNMAYMFYQVTYSSNPPSTTFNQPIGNWNTANVTDMSGMFFASDFNQDITNWNTGNVTSMGFMFYQAPFNQPIGNWNTANVTNMAYMFVGRFNINHPFNQPIGNWNTANVTNMSSMFEDCNFNQPIGNWNTGKVTDMSKMFYHTNHFVFNQPLGNWNTANVLDMNCMFSGTEFNQPIGNWNTAKVLDMNFMFSPTPFNQPLGNWLLNANVNLKDMFFQSNLDCTNYSETLIGWANQANVPSSRNLGIIQADYNLQAEPAHDYLKLQKSWSFWGDGPSGDSTCSAWPLQTTNNLVSELDLSEWIPNPSTTQSRITLITPEPTELKVILLDMQGRTIMHKSWKAFMGKNEFMLEIASLNSGIYQVIFTSPKVRLTRRLCVHH